MRFDTALVTGASAGIGEEFGHQLAPLCRRLVLVARRRSRLLDLARTLRGANPGLDVHVFEADLSNDASVDALVSGLAMQGLVPDLLVNNAGLGDYGDFASAPWDRIEAMLKVNVRALTRLCHSVVPAMKEMGGGSVINVSSLASILPIPDFAVYAATKAYVTSFSEADVTNMVLWRERVKGEFEKREGTKLTFTPMFIECITKVIPRFPWVNASVEGDKIIVKKDINLGMATALPSGNLIVPVIKAADQLNIVGLSHAVNGMADAARNNRLKPDDTVGGTFTLTNVGTFGSLMGTPIISQPQVAILAVGAIKKRPVVIESPNGDTIGIRHMMYLSLSYDHRIVDGSIGASFLTEVAKEMERWDINRAWYQYV